MLMNAVMLLIMYNKHFSLRCLVFFMYSFELFKHNQVTLTFYMYFMDWAL